MNGASYSSHGRDRPLAVVGSARRGTPLPAHERRLLLPLRAERSVGANAAADARLPLVPRGRLGSSLAGDRRIRPHLAPSWRPRARATRRGAPTAQRTGGTGAGDPRARTGGRQRPVRDPSARRRRRADDLGLWRSTLRPPRRTKPRRGAPRGNPHRGSRLPRAGLDAKHASVDGHRGKGAASRRRGRDHTPRRHPRDPGDPVVDRDRPGRANRMARRAPGPADRPRDLAHPP